MQKNSNLTAVQPHSLVLFLLFILTTNVSADKPKGLFLTERISETTCDKQVVVLGELPSHGEALGFQAKADLVQHLVNNCNFTAVFFEAPMYDFLGFQKAITTQQATQKQLNNTIGGFWNTQELKQWRHWLFTQSTSEKLTLAGLDDQISASSEYAKSTLPHLIGLNVTKQEQTQCQQAMERNLYWQYDEQHQYNQAEKTLLQQCTQKAADNITTDSKANLNHKEMLKNSANLYARYNNLITASNRDKAMYDNFQWQYKNLPHNSKVIIWTATVHAARQQGPLSYKPLGAWLAEQWQDNLAVIGFTAYSGESSMAGMPIQTIPAAPEKSLETLVQKLDSDWVFLNTTKLKDLGAVSSRLLGQFKTTNWYSLFDGVVVFKNEKAPTFEK